MQPLPTISDSLAELADTLTVLLEMIEGHRNRALALGYSPSAAEGMATTLHHLLIIRLIPPNLGGSPCPVPTPVA